MFFKNKVRDVFEVESISSAEMERVIDKCVRIYRGSPDWVDEEEGIKTIKFAKSICSEIARLTMLGTKITVDGSARAEWTQKQIDENIYFNLREWIEYGCAFGTVILKPNGTTVDFLKPNQFIVLEQDNGTINDIVFINQETDAQKKNYYTRLERHRFLKNGDYEITNKCYIGKSENDTEKPIEITNTPWAGLLEEVVIKNIKKPLYGVFKTPHANDVDLNSVMGVPVFHDAVEELMDLDIAYSRFVEEINDSRRIVLMDSDKLVDSGTRVKHNISGFEKVRKDMKLPKYVKNVYGNGASDFYKEINPTLQTETRIEGINTLLSQIGFKIGFSNGYFVFDEKTGMVTATQVESDDRRTIQFIKDMRDKLETCMDGLIYALNVFADLYELAPTGEYETVYDFGDITYNREEDRQRWWGYVVSGKVPAWMYFVKFEGMSEDEAKEMVAEATPQTSALFSNA